MKMRSLGHVLCAVVVASATGCAVREAKVTDSAESAQQRIAHSLDIDTTRLAGSGGDGYHVVEQLVTKHLATIGQLRAPRVTQERIEVIADLPTPRHALRAKIEKRPDDYCLLVIEAVRFDDDKETVVPEAPWWVIDALETVYREVRELGAPRRPAMSKDRFEQLRAQAEEFGAKGQDGPITPTAYVRSPHPIGRGDDAPYWAPASQATSTLRR